MVMCYGPKISLSPLGIPVSLTVSSQNFDAWKPPC